MDETTFWNLIDQSRVLSRGDAGQHHQLLIPLLAQYPESEIYAWDMIFDGLMDRAYRADLWEAATIVLCLCSDDGFIDFRAWLIGRGRDVYEQVLADPDQLAAIVEPGKEDDVAVGQLWYVEIGAYEAKTGLDVFALKAAREIAMPGWSRTTPELQGEFSPDVQTALTRFPRTAARFWKRCFE